MKIFIVLFILIVLFLDGFGQEPNQIVKQGWNFGALPTITFDSDLGFQYGAMVDLYNYGQGRRYPKYDHKLYFEVSRFTKGSGINRFFFDSDQLVEGLRTTFDLSYLSDQAYDFYGFNGFDAVYKKEFIDQNNPDEYLTRMYYKYDQKLFRLKLDLQGNISNERFRWVTGLNFLNFKLAPVNLDKLNKGKKGDDILPDVPGLYQKYQDWGIIKEDEADGGFLPNFKLGVVYDTRDNEPNPMRGAWTEFVLEGCPEVLGAESSFLKYALVHRQYFTLVPEDLSLVYRLAYQATLAGKVPFYYQTQVMTSFLLGARSEGLGGAKTLRGVLRNRIVGDGFFYGNIELRYKFARFQFINNNFYLGLNTFADFGQVTKKIPAQPITQYLPQQEAYFNYGAEKMHSSFGAGLRVVMNQNFIIAIDYGLATDPQDGDSGLYIGLNYLF